MKELNGYYPTWIIPNFRRTGHSLPWTCSRGLSSTRPHGCEVPELWLLPSMALDTGQSVAGTTGILGEVKYVKGSVKGRKIAVSDNPRIMADSLGSAKIGLHDARGVLLQMMFPFTKMQPGLDKSAQYTHVLRQSQ